MALIDFIAREAAIQGTTSADFNQLLQELNGIISHGDGTPVASMSQATADAGTATDAQLISALVLAATIANKINAIPVMTPALLLAGADTVNRLISAVDLTNEIGSSITAALPTAIDQITADAGVSTASQTISALILFNAVKKYMLGASASGWTDLTGAINVKGSGLNDPTFVIDAVNITGYEFSASVMNQYWQDFHIGHNYKIGGAVHFHAHLVDKIGGVGTVRIGFEYMLAKGHNQGAASVFTAKATIYTDVVMSGTANEHHVQDSVSIPATNIEPDTIIHVRVFRDATHVNDTLPNPITLIETDLHIETDRLATLNKVPNFYV